MALEQIFTTELIEKELITVELVAIDVVDYYRRYLEANLIHETATPVNPLPSKRFTTSNNFVTGTLTVYLNGVAEYYITIINSNTFEFEIDVIATDIITVEYIDSLL